jgi:fructose-1,6-bisphosphatase/inositol monophosphatase family enzyme
MTSAGSDQPAKARTRPLPWRRLVLEALEAANAAVRGMAPRSGQRVVAGRKAGYRSWDPEVIAVDTAAERAAISALRRGGVRGTLLSEEAGEVPLAGRIGRADAGAEPVYVIMDPFDGSMLYRRGIRAHWFSALGLYGRDGQPKAAGVLDHLSGEVVIADRGGAGSLPHCGGRASSLRPSRTTTLDGAFLETYMMKPSFLYATATALRPLLERAKFILPNGGPAAFADVACGRIDVYLAWNEALTEVFSACHIAERAGCMITHWDGSPVRFRPDIHAVYSLVVSGNPVLHREVLKVLKHITPPKGLSS